MPEVGSPSDGNYNYYQRRINDLQKEKDEEIKSVKEREAARLDNMENLQKKNLARRDREVEDSIRDVNSRSNDALKNEREMSKAENDKLRAATYNKQGRVISQENEMLKQQIKASDETLEEQSAQHKNNYSALQKNYDSRLENLQNRNQEELEQTTLHARDSANTAFTKQAEDQKKTYEGDRKESVEKYNRLDKQRTDEMNIQREASDRVIDQNELDFKHQRELDHHSNEAAAAKLDRATQAKADDTVLIYKKGREDSERDLRNQIKDLVKAEGQYMHEKGQGTQDAVREFSDEYRNKEQLMDEGYGKQIKKLREDAHTSDQYFADLNNKIIHEKDDYFAGVVGRQNQEAHKTKKDLENSLLRDHQQLEARNASNKQQAQTTLEHQLGQAAEAQNTALQTQAKSYGDTMQRQKQNDVEQIKHLEKALNDRNSGDDPSLVSPAAEAHIRKSVTNQYEKTYGADIERNKRSVDSIQKEYANRLDEVSAEKLSNETMLQRKKAADSHFDQNLFLDSVNEEKSRSQDRSHESETQHLREMTSSERANANMMERIRRSFELKLADQQNDSSAKVQATRQEADFNTKMIIREHSARTSDLIREYDQKMNDQKAGFDAQLDELKANSQNLLREGEKKARLDMEQQARSYEQRIAQMEYQHKERERYMTQNFQDEVDKVKRSNALLIQKKS